MDSPARTRFLRSCRRFPGLRRFLDNYGEAVDAVDEDGESLLQLLSGSTSLVCQALMLGWHADVVNDSCYPCVHSPLYEACDCGCWEEVMLMLRRPLKREALESALYWACHASNAFSWRTTPAALPALRGLIEQLGGFCPQAQPELLKLLIMGGVYPLIPEALAAGYELPPDDSPWWEGDEGAWSSADMRGTGTPAWRRALRRFVAEPRLAGSARRRCKCSRRMKKKYAHTLSEREWLYLLRASC